MNAFEYSKTLTPQQEKAFNYLLETRKRESGYYSRNVDSNNKMMELQRQARADMKEEFDAVEAEFRANLAEIRAKIAELNEQERALHKQHEEQDLALWNKAADKVEDQVKAIQEERGDTKAELALIEQIAITEYSKRLAKKNKVVA